MRNSFIKLLLINSLFLVILDAAAQKIQISTKLENIVVNKDTSFTRMVSVTLKKHDELINYPIFYDKELEDVSDIKVYLKKGKGFKLHKNPFITEEKINIDFITSKKVKSIIFHSETEAKITYTVKCNELMYFSDLPFFSYDDVDTLKYQITVPETFHFSHDVIYSDSLKFLVIDSMKQDNTTKWNINVVPVKVEPNPMMIFGFYRNIKEPLMRTVVVPISYKHKEKEYLNDWYLHNVETSRGLDSATIYKIDELTSGLTEPMEILDTLYSYVKSNFKYVAIEIGMGAFVPSHANEVFINKQGDCKDLSNFLSEALNYKGIKSNVALAATFDHISNCNFPSLSSANHVICVASIDGKRIILDPTDPIHLPETTVQSIQERSILIINSNGGEYFKINALPPQQNRINYEIVLNAGSTRKSMEGEFNASYKGISGNFLRRQFMDQSRDKMNALGKKHFESIMGNQTITNLGINNSGKQIDVKGKMSINGKLISDGNSQFLFVDFLPRIIETENRETLLEGTFIGNTIDKKVKLRIIMDEPFKAFNPIEQTYANRGISLNYKITNPADSIIECTYEFILDYIFIDKENLDIINEILKSFKKITNEPIILKNQDQ